MIRTKLYNFREESQSNSNVSSRNTSSMEFLHKIVRAYVLFVTTIFMKTQTFGIHITRFHRFYKQYSQFLKPVKRYFLLLPQYATAIMIDLP